MEDTLPELAKYWPHALGGTGAVIFVYVIIRVSFAVRQWWAEWKEMQRRIKLVMDNHLKHIEANLASIDAVVHKQNDLLARIADSLEVQNRNMGILLDRIRR